MLCNREENYMPSVQVNVWEGWGEKNAETVIRGVTKVFTDMGIPAQAVEVIIHEIPKTHWGIQGEPASVVMKDVNPPI
jgi:4-oxalocrotonate tautomerase